MALVGLRLKGREEAELISEGNRDADRFFTLHHALCTLHSNKNGPGWGHSCWLVPKARLELARAITHHPLKMACLPVPPLRQNGGLLFSKPPHLSSIRNDYLLIGYSRQSSYGLKAFHTPIFNASYSFTLFTNHFSPFTINYLRSTLHFSL